MGSMNKKTTTKERRLKCEHCGKAIDRAAYDGQTLATIGTREFHRDCAEVVWRKMNVGAR
jgi:hypothetical protein